MIDLRHGDCLEIMKDIPDESIDVSFTSPPYNSVRHKKYKNYNDDLKDYYSFLCKFTDELLRITKRAVIINVQANYYNRPDVYKYIGKYCNEISRIIIWNKSNPQPSSMRHKLTNAYEFFMIFSKEPSVNINSVFMKDVVNYPINSVRVKGHSAVMNNDLCDLFIREFTKESDTVLDPFMGSGTTAVAALECNRKYIGFEIIPEYVEFANDRIQKLGLQDTNGLW